MRTRESEEMYLETILLLKQKSANVHSVDVVGELNYAKSSVSRGMNLLVKNGYITMDRVTGVIEFTEKGREKANNIYERHRVLTKALEKIGASAEMAETATEQEPENASSSVQRGNKKPLVLVVDDSRDFVDFM